MPQTLSVVQAVVGGVAGSLAPRADVIAVAREVLDVAVEDGRLLDARAYGHGPVIALVLSYHEPSEPEAGPHPHRIAWDAISAAADAARRLKLEGAGHGLGADAYPGTLAATGAAVAQLTLDERPSEVVLVCLGARTAVGAFNYPVVRAFADPFANTGLASSSTGFNVEVHDLDGRRKTMFALPSELHELVVCASAGQRYVVKHVVTGRGEVAAAASTERSAEATGSIGDDTPVLIERAGGAFPAPADLAALLGLTPAVPSDGGPAMPWSPEALPRAGEVYAGHDRWPRVHALSLQLAHGRFVDVRDVLAGPSFDGARARARDVSAWAESLGPFAPGASMGGEPQDSGGRWSEM